MERRDKGGRGMVVDSEKRVRLVTMTLGRQGAC